MNTYVVLLRGINVRGKNLLPMKELMVEKYIAETERYQVTGDVFYLHAPDGIGRSKLVANIESCLGVSATGRNLNTVNKLKGILIRS